MLRNPLLAIFSRPGSTGPATAIFALLSAAFLIAPMAAMAAPLPVEKSTYSLTFPDGWQDAGLGMSGDTSYVVMNEDLGDNVVAWGYGLTFVNPIQAALLIRAYTMAFSTQYARTDSSQKTLGGHVFTTSEYEDTTTSEDSTARVRVYITTKGNFMFLTYVFYDSEVEDEVVGQMEAALATLEIKASSSLHRVTRVPTVGESIRSMDVLGRIRSPAKAAQARVPSYRIH